MKKFNCQKCGQRVALDESEFMDVENASFICPVCGHKQTLDYMVKKMSPQYAKFQYSLVKNASKANESFSIGNDTGLKPQIDERDKDVISELNTIIDFYEGAYVIAWFVFIAMLIFLPLCVTASIRNGIGALVGALVGALFVILVFMPILLTLKYIILNVKYKYGIYKNILEMKMLYEADI